MKSYHLKHRWLWSLPSLCFFLFAVSGCAILGPRSISMGRADYNEAINETEEEQMLLSIVMGRYGKTYSPLAVSGVAANVRFRTNAGIEAGFGPRSTYDGNLVPFRGGLAYEENPTITYSPVDGEKYLRQLLSPLPLDLLVLIVRSGTNVGAPLTLLTNRINDMRNPDFLEGVHSEVDSRFVRFVQLTQELHQAGVIQFVEDPRPDVSFDLLVSNYSPNYSEKVQEYFRLLKLRIPMDESEDIILPLYFAVGGHKLNGIAISTRSTFDLIEILRAAIDIPQEHAKKRITINYPELGLAGKDLRIHSSQEKPTEAEVAVKYRGYWFYIDESDMRTKLYFLMIRTLWSVSIAAVSNQRAAPVLTLPVSQ